MEDKFCGVERHGRRAHVKRHEGTQIVRTRRLFEICGKSDGKSDS